MKISPGSYVHVRPEVSPLNVGIMEELDVERGQFWAYTGCCHGHFSYNGRYKNWVCSECQDEFPISSKSGPGFKIREGHSSDFRAWVRLWTGLINDELDIMVEWE